jgi:hypothetical protein
MNQFKVERLGHVNNIASDVHPLRAAYVKVFGADVFSDWSNPDVGSSNCLLLISGTCIEIFAVDDEEKILGKYLRRHGPGWHSLEWTVPSQGEAEEIAAARHLRVTDRVDDAYVWLHPKDCHGLLLELSTHHFAGDSRDTAGWEPTYWSDEHPLGIVGLNCIRVTSREPLAAAEWLADLTGTNVSYDEPRSGAGGRAAGVALADHVIEFIGAVGNGPIGEFLERQGERMHSVAFDVKDIAAASAFLSDQGIATSNGSGPGRIYIDPAVTSGSLIELVTAA